MEAAIMEFLGSNRNAFLYFSICISLPSSLLYFAEIWTIIRHKSFHNSFYKLFVIRAFTDLLYTLTSYSGSRIPNMFPEWFLHLSIPNLALSTFLFLTSYTHLADNLTTGFILFNRLTAIVRPLTHEQIWHKLMPFVVLAVYGIPLYAVGMLGIQAKIVADRDSQGNLVSTIYVTDAGTSGTLMFYMELSTFWSILFLVCCTLINVATLIAYRHQQKQQQNAIAMQRADGIERKLWMFAVFTFIGHMLIAFLLIILCFATIAGNVFVVTSVNSQYSWVMDFGMVVLPSWLLLWASPSFRKKLLADFLPPFLYDKLVGGQPQLSSIKIILSGTGAAARSPMGNPPAAVAVTAAHRTSTYGTGGGGGGRSDHS